MIKISDLVEDLVRQTPFIAEALTEGLINTSALARQYQPTIEAKLGKPVKTGAIIMALNRMDAGTLTYERHQLQAFFQKLRDMLVRTSLIDYTFQHSPTIAGCTRALLKLVAERPDVFCTFSQGVAENTIVVTETIATDLETIFHQEVLLDKEPNLAAITLLLPAENKILSGIYYVILKELAWRGINVVEVISTSNEFTIVVNQENLERAFSAVHALRM